MSDYGMEQYDLGNRDRYRRDCRTVVPDSVDKRIEIVHLGTGLRKI